MNTTLNDIFNRRSIRKYKPQCPEEDKLEMVIKAGMCAPTGMNQQSPIIICVTNPEDMETLEALNARVRSQTRPYYGAPAALLVLARADSPYALQDGSLVMGNMMNAAYSIGLGTCWINSLRQVMELPEGKALLKKWGVEGEYVGIASCIIGYPDESPEMKPRKDKYVYYVR